MRSLPNVAVAGLGGLLIFGLAFATWDRDADTAHGVARGETRESGSQESEYMAVKVVLDESPLQDGASRHPDVAGIPPTQEAPVPDSSDSGSDLAQETIGPDSLDHPDILKSDAEQAQPAQLADNAAEQLVGEVAQTASSQDNGAPTGKVPKTGRVAVQQVSDPVVAPVAGPPESTAPEAASIQPLSEYADESELSGLAGDQQDTSDKITSNLVDTPGVEVDDVDPLPVSDTGAAITGPSAEAEEAAIAISPGDPLPESTTEETVPPAQTGDDLVLRHVTEASSSDQRDMDALTDRQREIEQALALAEMAMDKDHLLTPTDDNAYGHFQRVLQIDALNEDAQAGIARIVQRYRVLAKWALGRNKLEESGRYLERGLRLDPDNVRLLALQDVLNDSIAEVETAKLSRVALEMEQPKPIVEPPQPRESSYNTWMRAADGL